MPVEGISAEQLRREGVAAETIRIALLPIIEREFEKALSQLDKAIGLEAMLDARADIRLLRSVMRQLDHKYRISKE